MSAEKSPSNPCAGAGAGGPAGATTTPCPLAGKKTMTEAEAQQEMNKFKQTDIPFDYPVDCCYARARKMNDMLEKDGYSAQKFWYGGDLSRSDLHPTKVDGSPVDFPPGSGQDISWRYHVAPIVNVVHPDGTTTETILDPSLSDTPLSKADWMKRVGSTPSPSERTTPSDTMFPWANPPGTMSTAQADSDMQKHRDNRDKALGKP